MRTLVSHFGRADFPHMIAQICYLLYHDHAFSVIDDRAGDSGAWIIKLSVANGPHSIPCVPGVSFWEEKASSPEGA